MTCFNNGLISVALARPSAPTKATRKRKSRRLEVADGQGRDQGQQQPADHIIHGGGADGDHSQPGARQIELDNDVPENRQLSFAEMSSEIDKLSPNICPGS